jgi:CheY-like chemotaxis protein
MPKILYAEDVEFLREGITADLALEPEFVVASCDLNFKETIQQVNTFKPDVLLLDVMSSTNIHEGIRIAKALAESTGRKTGALKILLLTIFRKDDDTIKKVLADGHADDIITKPTTSENIVKKIHKIMKN